MFVIGVSELKLKEMTVEGQGSSTLTENETVGLAISCCEVALAERVKFAVCPILA